MSKEWYVIHTYTGKENIVKENIERKIELLGLKDKVGQILVPEEKVAEIRGGKKKTATRKYFPGYVLIEMEMNQETLEAIRSVPGVTGFLGTVTKPVPLKKEEVEALLAEITGKGGGLRPKVTYEKGELVKVIEGPFANFTGTVEEVDMERRKLKINISIFGRPIPLELDIFQVERA